MEKTTTLFDTEIGACCRCYECVRRCPVKAVKLTESALEIDPDRCVYCGACLAACSQGAISLVDGSVLAKELIAAGPTVAVVAPELDAAWPGVSRPQLHASLRALGFYAVEDMVMGEEIVAAAYSDILTKDADRPVVRSR